MVGLRSMVGEGAISPPMLLVLNAVGPARDGLCGHDIILTSGLAPEALPPALARLEEMGWLCGDWTEGGGSEIKDARRRLYRLSDTGRSKVKDITSILLRHSELSA